MRNVVLSLVVVAVLVAGGLGGTFAGFVDTEVSKDNFIQAGITDLLINGNNDPDVEAKIQFDHMVPTKSLDFWIDALNWGECSGGDLYMHFKDVVSEEAGTKLHMGGEYVYDGVAPGNATLDVPKGYRIAVGVEPKGAGVWSSEPEKISEVGGGYIAQKWISSTDPALMDEDYASGIADHLDITVRVPLKGQAGGNILGNPDLDGDGKVSSTEEGLWNIANRWEVIADISGKLVDIECNKELLGFLKTQEKTFIHVDVDIQQIQDILWPAFPACDYDGDTDIDADDEQKSWFPTNALQGDLCTWDMLFELTTDP